MSEIEALTAKIESLSSSADSWNTVMLWCLAITAIAAIITFLATRQVVVKTSQLAAAQQQLGDAKDRALQSDLKSKDDEIANLTKESEAAKRDAARFKLDITQAQERAADANKSAAEAKLSLEIFKAPRSLTHIPEMIEALMPYKGVEYGFGGVGDDEESFSLLRQIDALLQQAEWKRVEMPQSFPSIRLGGGTNLSVTVALTSGVRIAVQSTDPQGSLQTEPISELPLYVKAAVALNLNLASNITPSPDGKSAVDVKTGGLKIVMISVGRKPITTAPNIR